MFVISISSLTGHDGPRFRCAAAATARLCWRRSRRNNISAYRVRTRNAGLGAPPICQRRSRKCASSAPIGSPDQILLEGRTAMYAPPGVKTDSNYPIPGQHEGLGARRSRATAACRQAGAGAEKAEVLVRIDAVAICATDLEIIYHGPPALIHGGLPFNKSFTPGHEYMGTVVALGPGRRRIPDRPARHGRDPRRLRPMQALPRRHVHRLPQLWPQLRRCRQRPSRQWLHHRWRLLRISGQQHQHAGRHSGRHVG